MEETLPLYFGDAQPAIRKSKPLASLGPNSVFTVCPFCKRGIHTIVKLEISLRTHFLAGLLFIFGCCCFPYILNWCMDKNHYCPKCNAHIGRFAS